MPYKTVAALKLSAIYLKTKMMQEWTEEQLARFADVFDRVFDRVKRNGGDEVEAESTANAIAFGAARRAPRAAFASAVESEVHWFVPMASEQLGTDGAGITGAVYSFKWMAANLEVVKAAVEGLHFNLDHNQGVPAGIIRKLALPADVPAEVRAAADKDAPYFMAASYHPSIPDDMREEKRISAEWIELHAADGTVEAIPLTFAKTKTPLNGTTSGISKVAGTEIPAKPKIPPVGSTRNLRPTMPDESDLTTKVASLEASLQKETARAQAAEAKFTALKEANAALEAAIKGREATEAANAAIAAGKFPTEKREYLAAFYVKHGKEEFASLIEALPTSTLGVSAGKAVAQAGFNTTGNEAVNRMAATVTANLTKGRVV